jgi:tetratricopeptide (TPR) repeat protein
LPHSSAGDLSIRELYTKSHAIVIGISNYRDEKLRLKNPVNDANAIAKVLRENHGFDDVELIIEEDASKQKLELLFEDRIRSSEITKDDRLLIYYSGHGEVRQSTDQQGRHYEESYILPYDARLGSFGSYLNLNTVTDNCQRCSAKHVLLILDSCYSGTALIQGRNLKPDEQITDEYLRRITSKRSLQALAATDRTQLALDSGSGIVGLSMEHGAFSGCLLDVLSRKFDPDNDGILTASEVGSFLQKNIPRSKIPQNPLYGYMPGSENGEFIFNIYKVSQSRDAVSSPLSSFVNELSPLAKAALDYFKRRDYDRAIIFYDRILEINPNHVESLNRKGISYLRLNRFNEARECFEQVLKIEADNFEALDNMDRLKQVAAFDHTNLSKSNILGILAIIGPSNKGKPFLPRRISSIDECKEHFGDTGSLTRDIALAFDNGATEILAMRVVNQTSHFPSGILRGRKRDLVKFTARRKFKRLVVQVLPGATDDTVRLQVEADGEIEDYDNLTMVPISTLNLVNIINTNSKSISAESLISDPQQNPIPQRIEFQEEELDPLIRDYERAFEILENEPEVGILYLSNVFDPAVHRLADAHCQIMSNAQSNRGHLPSPRLAICSVSALEPVGQAVLRTQILASDSTILVAPSPYGAAVAALISRLEYPETVTNKEIVVNETTPVYNENELALLAQNGILAVKSNMHGGVIANGRTTSKEDIRVMRIAYHAVRGIINAVIQFSKNKLETKVRVSPRIRLEAVKGFSPPRSAYLPDLLLDLKKEITNLLISMEKDGAITENKKSNSPEAFLFNISTESLEDFIDQIVRIDISLRITQDSILSSVNFRLEVKFG